MPSDAPGERCRGSERRGLTTSPDIKAPETEPLEDLGRENLGRRWLYASQLANFLFGL